MKSTMLFRAAALSGLASVSLFATRALASAVLLINVSDPSNVTFSAVANNSAITGTSRVDYSDGITLDNFFTSNQSILLGNPLAISGNLTAAGTALSYNETVTFSYGNPNPVPGVDLSIYYNTITPGANQTFVTTAPPFTGVGSADMSPYASALPAHGASGSVLMSYQGGLVIGEWQAIAVPEPEEYAAAAGAGLALLIAYKKFRKA